MTDDEVRARAKELIGDLDPGMTREQRDARFREAANKVAGAAGPNMPHREARTIKNPVGEEIRRLWADDVQAHPPTG